MSYLLIYPKRLSLCVGELGLDAYAGTLVSDVIQYGLQIKDFEMNVSLDRDETSLHVWHLRSRGVNLISANFAEKFLSSFSFYLMKVKQVEVAQVLKEQRLFVSDICFSLAPDKQAFEAVKPPPEFR